METSKRVSKVDGSYLKRQPELLFGNWIGGSVCSSSDGRKRCSHGSGYAENRVLNLIILSDGGAVGAKE